MDIVFISGGCGVGKRRVGQELKKMTGLCLIHNHLTTNIVREVYGDRSIKKEGFDNLMISLRTAILSNFQEFTSDDLIMTHSNHERGCRSYVTWLDSYCIEHSIGLKIFNLTCDEVIRKERFLSPERKSLGKPCDLATFEKINRESGLPKTIDSNHNVISTYDTTESSAYLIATWIMSDLQSNRKQ